MFSKWGPVDEVQIVYDHQSGRSRGFAFIYMHNVDDATDVSLKLQDKATFYIYLITLYQDDLTTEKKTTGGYSVRDNISDGYFIPGKPLGLKYLLWDEISTTAL